MQTHLWKFKPRLRQKTTLDHMYMYKHSRKPALCGDELIEFVRQVLARQLHQPIKQLGQRDGDNQTGDQGDHVGATERDVVLGIQRFEHADADNVHHVRLDEEVAWKKAVSKITHNRIA